MTDYVRIATAQMFRFLKTQPLFLEYLQQTAQPDPITMGQQFDPNAIIIKVTPYNHKVTPYNHTEPREIYAVSVLDLISMDQTLTNNSLTDEDTKLFANHDPCICDDIIEVTICSSRCNPGAVYLAAKKDLELLNTSDDPITDLQEALAAKDYRRAFYILSTTKNRELTETSSNNESALHCMAQCGHKYLFEYVLRRLDADTICEATYECESDDNSGCTVLHYIAKYGNTELARSLIRIRPDLMYGLANMPSSGYCTDHIVPLHDALIRGNYKLASILLEYTKPEHIDTIFTDAIRKKNVRLFELLLGAETVMQYEQAITKVQPQCRAALTTVNKYGRTNLHVAAQHYEPAIFEVVYDAAVKADLLLCQCVNSGLTFFNELISYGNSETIIELTRRSDFDAKLLTMLDSGGCSPFHWAAGRGLEDVCELLYNIYDDRTCLLTKSKYGYTPLILAVQGRHMSTVNYILNKPDLSTLLDIDGADKCALLDYAVLYSSPEVCRILYERMNTHRICSQPGKDRYTVLHIAAMYGRAEMVDVLLEDPTKARALLPIADAKGKTAIEYTDRYPAIQAKLTQALLRYC